MAKNYKKDYQDLRNQHEALLQYNAELKRRNDCLVLENKNFKKFINIVAPLLKLLTILPIMEEKKDTRCVSRMCLGVIDSFKEYFTTYWHDENKS